jgi:hypothetical protein
VAGTLARPPTADSPAPAVHGRPRTWPPFGWRVWLAAITLLGAALRLVWLPSIPPGLFFDVAANLFDVLDIRNGTHPIWFARNNGREPLMLYATAGASLLFGPTALAAKAAIFGIATIPAAYLFGREAAARLGERAARVVGLLSALVLATLYWHVHFSRLGLRTITLPLFLALGLGLLLRAVRLRSLRTAALAGTAMGIATYTYTSIRLAPIALVPFLALALGLAPNRRLVSVAALFAAVWLAVSAPLGIYYWRHPAEVEGRTDAVSVLNAEVSGGDPVGATLHGLRATALSTVWRGSASGLENLPGRPLFEPVTGFGFVVGVGVALVSLGGRWWARRRSIGAPAALLLLAMLGAMGLSSALSVNPPGFVRISGMVPPAVVLAALGLYTAGDWARPRLGHLFVPVAVVSLAVPLVWTSYDYFGRWYGGGVAYRWVMEDKVQAAERIAAWQAHGERVFLAPLYARDYTFAYLLRDHLPESFDLGAGLVVPASGAVRYAFPPEDRDGLAAVAERLGAPARFEMVADRSGEHPLLATLALEAAPPPPARERVAAFGPGVELLQAHVEPSAVRPGGVVQVALTWRATQPLDRDYSVFVHGRLGEQTRFQRDRMPGDGSIPTSRWRPGDRIGDYYRIELPRDLAPGDYRLVVGLYELSTGQRLRLVDHPGAPNELEVGHVRVAG